MTDSTRDADDEAMRAEVTFTGGKVDGFAFKVDTFAMTIGSFLTMGAEDFYLDTRNSGTNDPLVVFGALSADVTIGSWTIGGEGRNFYITGNGDFKPGNPFDSSKRFGVTLRVGGADGSNFKWPTWMPIRIYSIGLDWDDIENKPWDFDLVVSATVATPPIKQLAFSGTIDGIRIRPSLLLEGKFPVIDIQAIGVTVAGSIYYVTINAGMIGGIVKIAKSEAGEYSIIEATDTSTPVYDRILFVGIEGGASLLGAAGLNIRMALSELGPLGMTLTATVPIPIEPTVTGLTINELSAEVEFFKTLPDVTDPFELRDPAFDPPTTSSDSGDWLFRVKKQVLQQFVALQENPDLNGFTAAFTEPFVFKGLAKLSSSKLSPLLFNGDVGIILSTDGKMLISGKLNFLFDQVTTTARLYANLGKIAAGEAVVLFLADLPDEIPFGFGGPIFTIDGRLQMGFRDASGNVVDLPAPISSVDSSAGVGAPTASLAFPTDDRSDAATLNANKDTAQDPSPISITAPLSIPTRNSPVSLPRPMAPRRRLPSPPIPCHCWSGWLTESPRSRNCRPRRRPTNSRCAACVSSATRSLLRISSGRPAP